ncbi:Stk1 family PASTA domain-containing Ser/Thr kinase [Paenibacillus sp. TRM 82003]|nr:Stk1 family PASTA domain-containing Ser/Thr kinase [Paenibacillus sp. TRM 82003]
MNGTTLSGRYELIERVGGGGMALVYKAKDTLLNRNVAVKILRQQYVHDEEFIRRFRREAQSAASLSHPNVVSVYDVGQDEDTHFIVMEYIEGSNLNDIIKAQAPLQAAEAVHIATQICDALDHAHANGIIHRDIKPHNILIGKNGRVKVTDFGIARAITSSTITQTGSVIGSVHYFSPEHAKGVSAGEKSDLYSLGIVLYQMLTARLPFIGESPISVALKHLQEAVEEPRIVNPMIPQSVENVILKSMRKRPEERYTTAGEMLRDLETCLSPERREEIKWTYASDDDDAEATRVMPAIRPDSRPKAAGDGEEARAPSTSSGAPVWRDGAYEDEEEERRSNPWIKPIIWFVVLLALLGAAWYGVKYVQDIMIIEEVEVPNVVGLPLERAKEELEKAGFAVQPIVHEANRETMAGYVISQSKPGGETARAETTPIGLTVSKGIEKVAFPAVVGMSEREARSAITGLGIPEESIDVRQEYSEEGEGGVIEQIPSANEEVDPLDVSIVLVVSQGREDVDMPDLVGKTLEEARALLEREGLELNDKNIEREPRYFEEGRVAEQHPYKPGEAVKPPGEDIMVTVSSGLPQEARVTTYTVRVGPAQQEQSSTVRIVLTDAMGERVEVVNQAVQSEQSLPFRVVTSPTKDAVIEVYRDGTLLDQLTWTHGQARDSGGSAGSPAGNDAGGDEEAPPEAVPASGDTSADPNAEPGAAGDDTGTGIVEPIIDGL